MVLRNCSPQGMLEPMVSKFNLLSLVCSNTWQINMDPLVQLKSMVAAVVRLNSLSALIS